MWAKLSKLWVVRRKSYSDPRRWWTSSQPCYMSLFKYCLCNFIRSYFSDVFQWVELGKRMYNVVLVYAWYIFCCCCESSWIRLCLFRSTLWWEGEYKSSTFRTKNKFVYNFCVSVVCCCWHSFFGHICVCSAFAMVACSFATKYKTFTQLHVCYTCTKI